MLEITDELSLGEIDLDEVKKEIEKVRKYYDALRKIALPKSLDAVSDDKEPLTEKLSPKLEKKVFKGWNIRAIKIEKVNEALANFEIGVVEELTVSNASILFHEVHKLIQKFEWIAGNIGKLTLLLGGSLAYVQGRWGRDIWDSLKGAVTAGLDGLREGEFDELAEKLDVLKGTLGDAATFLIKSATFGLVAKILHDSISGISGTYYTKIINPIRLLKAVTETQLQGDAFPQGGKRHRRYKPHRVNH